MLAYENQAFFPIMKVIENKPAFYVAKIVDVDNDYDHEGDEFILAKYWENMYIKCVLM